MDPTPPAPAGLATAALTAGLITADRPSDAELGDSGGLGDGEVECPWCEVCAEVDVLPGYGVKEGVDEDAMEIGDASPTDAGLEARENVGENAVDSASRFLDEAIGMGADAFIVAVLPLAERTVCGGDGGCSCTSTGGVGGGNPSVVRFGLAVGFTTNPPFFPLPSFSFSSPDIPSALIDTPLLVRLCRPAPTRLIRRTFRSTNPIASRSFSF